MSSSSVLRSQVPSDTPTEKRTRCFDVSWMWDLNPFLREALRDPEIRYTIESMRASCPELALRRKLLRELHAIRVEGLLRARRSGRESSREQSLKETYGEESVEQDDLGKGKRRMRRAELLQSFPESSQISLHPLPTPSSGQDTNLFYLHSQPELSGVSRAI